MRAITGLPIPSRTRGRAVAFVGSRRHGLPTNGGISCLRSSMHQRGCWSTRAPQWCFVSLVHTYLPTYLGSTRTHIIKRFPVARRAGTASQPHSLVRHMYPVPTVRSGCSNLSHCLCNHHATESCQGAVKTAVLSAKLADHPLDNPDIRLFPRSFLSILTLLFCRISIRRATLTLCARSIEVSRPKTFVFRCYMRLNQSHRYLSR